MDIESLKIFAEIATTLSTEAKTMFVWWVVLKGVLPSVLWFFGFIIFLVVSYKLIRKGMGDAFEEEFQSLRDTLGIGSYGRLSPMEYQLTVQKIRALIAQHQNRREK
jgi:hypothetical protein